MANEITDCINDLREDWEKRKTIAAIDEAVNEEESPIVEPKSKYTIELDVQFSDDVRKIPQLTVRTYNVVTSAVAPYIERYVEEREAEKEQIPYAVGTAVLTQEGATMDAFYGKEAAQGLRDRVQSMMNSNNVVQLRKTKATPPALPPEAYGKKVSEK